MFARAEAFTAAPVHDLDRCALDEWAIARATKYLINEAPEAAFGTQHNTIVAMIQMIQKCGDFGVTPSTAAGLISEQWIETKSETAAPEEVEKIATSIKNWWRGPWLSHAPARRC